MTNPMVEANVVIIDELKKFMNEAINIKTIKAKYCNSVEKDFTRNRVLTFSTLVQRRVIFNIAKLLGEASFASPHVTFKFSQYKIIGMAKYEFASRNLGGNGC
jgi:hypothetical protein